MGVILKTLDTKGFCIFCLKKLDGKLAAGPRSKKREDKQVFQTPQQTEAIRTFSKLITRYLGGNLGYRGEDDAKQSEVNLRDGDLINVKQMEKETFIDFGSACVDCHYTVAKFSKSYFKMKKMELLVGWQVRKLKDIVASSARVPTRVRSFSNEFYKKGKEETEKLKEIEVFRKEFVSKCTRKIQTSPPRIHLFGKRKDALPIKRRKVAEIESQPILATIVKEEPNVVSTPKSSPAIPALINVGESITSELNVTSSVAEAPPSTEIEVIQNFEDFHTNDDEMMDYEYEYPMAMNEQKILPIQSSPSSLNRKRKSDNTELSGVDIPSSSDIPKDSLEEVREDLQSTNEKNQNVKDKVTRENQHCVGCNCKADSEQILQSLNENNISPDHSGDNQLQSLDNQPAKDPEQLESDLANVNETNKDVSEEEGPRRSLRNLKKPGPPGSADPTGTDEKSSKEDNEAIAPETSNSIVTEKRVIVKIISAPASEGTPQFGNAVDKTGKRLPVCSLCNRTFTSAAQLAPHMYTHADPKSWPFHCKYCTQRFYRVSDFKRHRISVLHNKNKKMYKTQKTGKVLPSKSGQKLPAGPSSARLSQNSSQRTSSTTSVENAGAKDSRLLKVVKIIYPASATENSNLLNENPQVHNDAVAVGQAPEGSSNSKGIDIVTID